MRFNDYPYKRPDLKTFEKNFLVELAVFKDAKNVETQEAALDCINQMRFDFDTMSNLASIRHSMNTKDAFYDAENSFFDDANPIFAKLNHRFYEALANSHFRETLEARKGNLLFAIAEQTLRTYSDAILDDMKKENALVTEYGKLLAAAEIIFEGETRNLSQMAPFVQSKDRTMRKRASKAVSTFFETHEDQLDDLFDQLVMLRTKMAKKLGYKRFTELAYDRLGRLDYGAVEVATYRKQVKEEVVPIVKNLIDRKVKRLNIKTLKHYDLPLDFLSGNPTPKGKKDWLVEHAKTMYSEMSPETDEFFAFMLEKDLMDLETKPGKAGGGYCTYIANHKSPFIFANFNGTAHDVDVLTHEAGHAFQVYSSRHHVVPEYIWPTYEACEIHSMSMEFFAWPWVQRFFEEDTDKYRFSHIAGSLSFIPYGVAVDEFQHAVYDRPELSKAERKALWRSIEKIYLPYKVYDDDDFLERGGFWFRQGHIFNAPFYYIDYTLAQVCAFDFWIKSQTNHEEAWQRYVRLCQAGGSKTFLELLKLAGLKNPFEQGSIAKIIPHLERFLNSIDDTKL